MIAVGIYIYTNNFIDLSNDLIDNLALRVSADSGTFESYACLLNQLQTLGGYYGNASRASKIELFADEKISINSSIQNINDISKTFTDFSQTFTVPASKQNNKIFKHWYENSNNSGFSTLIKADAYIELDTILFRTGKIQLESANVKNGQPQDYSITFIGALGSLKDKFKGLFLKDLTSTTNDFAYTPDLVRDKVTTQTTSPAFPNIKFPLISSSRYWNYGANNNDDISHNNHPIRFDELFPAIKISAVLDMIANDNNILNLNFNGSFLADARFTNAYLYLKNAELFTAIPNTNLITWDSILNGDSYGFNIDLTNDSFSGNGMQCIDQYAQINITATTAGITYNIHTFKNGIEILKQTLVSTTSIVGIFLTNFVAGGFNPIDVYTVKISSISPITFSADLTLGTTEDDGQGGYINTQITINKNGTQTTPANLLPIKSYFPEIKIEDFFSGLLKMFNLTCYSTDGINYTLEQLESYYTSGNIIDITKYIKSDNVALNRVKTYKKIKFEYEKSESLVNVGFNSANGIEYGSLFYDTGNDGEEYNIKLPFENLNFSNLKDKLQVGYALKSDGVTKYIPKPIILYDYSPSALTALTGTTFHFSTVTSGGSHTTSHTSYKAFGQEFFNGTDTFSLNFNSQQSTLTNQLVNDSLYNEYYENYIANIFNSKARLIKVSGILPTSLLTTLELNDRLIIRDKRYLINTFTTDLTTGEVQFELLTDFRIL